MSRQTLLSWPYIASSDYPPIETLLPTQPYCDKRKHEDESWAIDLTERAVLATDNASKRCKVDIAAEVICLSDDDDEGKNEVQHAVSEKHTGVEKHNERAINRDPEVTQLFSPETVQQHQTPIIGPKRPMDHNGSHLSDGAFNFAKLYWDCQREHDHCPLDAMNIQGPQPEQSPLERMAIFRRLYTSLVLGVEELEPGTRTMEPPYVPPPPVIDPNAMQFKAEDNGGHEILPMPPSPERKLSPEQAAVVELVASGRNVFYTGSAGCGKSTVLHAIKKRLRDQGLIVRVMGPTGMVALAINGDTTWRFAGMSPTSLKRPLEILLKSISKPTKKRFTQTDVVIMDEISMVENHHFERINMLVKKARMDDRPFGGLQVIVTGDFCQLPPVKPFSTCMHCGRDMRKNDTGDETVYTCPECKRFYRESEKWAFRSNAWKECDFSHVYLHGVHRQNDPQFINMLQKCRLGIPFLSNETHLLMNHESTSANAITLFSTRAEVSQENDKRFAALKTPAHSYKCHDHFDWNGSDHQIKVSDTKLAADGFSLYSLSDHRFSSKLILKVGMPVVLLANLDIAGGLCNGSQGIIAKFEPYSPDKVPKKTTTNGTDPSETLQGDHALLREKYIREFCEAHHKEAQAHGGGQPLQFPVVRWLRDMSPANQRVIYPDCQVSERGEPSKDPSRTFSLLSRTQVPLAPAWAISIHKSQGMTLDRVIVDLSRAFEEGQVYVALSRATSLKGLTVRGDPNGLAVGAGGNREVRAFLKERFGI